MLSIAVLSLCALPQEIVEPAPALVVSHEQQLADFIDEATTSQSASELRSQLRNLKTKWPALTARLIEATLLSQPENNSKIAAAVRLAGELGDANEDLLRRLVVLLDSRQFAAVSRAALSSICGREFADSEAFEMWYATAAGQSREQWLETVLQEQWQQEEQLWQQRLSQSTEIAVITLAMQHRRRAVREIAFASLANVNLSELKEKDLAAINSVFAMVFDTERDLQLRLQLLQQVPRFVLEREATSMLMRAIEKGKPVEATEASRQLAFISPKPFAWQALLRALDGSYSAIDASEPRLSTDIATRLALWTGFSSLEVRPPDIKQSQVDLLLQRGLGQEAEDAVLEKIYVCTGRHAGVDFLPILEAVVFDANNSALHRSAALLSMTSVAERSPNATLITKLASSLLSDPEVQVRAQAIASLRKLNPEGGFDLLADRLSQETQVVVQKQLLSSLAQQRSTAIIDKLLVFVPTVELTESYLRALTYQIDNDISLLATAIDSLLPRQDFQNAVLLVRSFPLANLGVDDNSRLNELHATVLSEHVLKSGLDSSMMLLSDDALLRLHEMQQLNPSVGKWLVYELRLRLLRNEAAHCIEKLKQLAVSDATATAKWSLALDTMAAAVKQEIVDAVNIIRLAMLGAEEMPSELEFRASQLFDISTPPELRDQNPKQDQGAAD
ncbi:MAG: hypothetical protein H8E25_10120 [Planctomycetes bacterium]|nr:hypothetical protein [Planctomycetota bacterium]